MFDETKNMPVSKIQINNEIFLRALVGYPYFSNSSGTYIYHITDVKAFWEEDKREVEVVIRTHLPGILIGAKGGQISGIKNLMELRSGHKVSIKIVEEDMFYFDRMRE
jgi:hypothetical protein